MNLQYFEFNKKMGCKNSLISRGALAIANAPLFLILSQSKNTSAMAQIQLKNKQSLLINYKLKHLFHGAHRFG